MAKKLKVTNFFLITFGKLIAIISRLLNLGHGSTWPGHIALSVNKNFIKEIIKANPDLKIILIAGTNGKTTTGRLIQTILEKTNHRVFQNESGANLLNGIASSLLLRSSILGKIQHDFVIFEIDENTLPLILKEINNPDFVIILNLFRDQLDRYGEVNTIALKWKDAIGHLLSKTTLILNADDPQIAYLGYHSPAKTLYFGVDRKNSKKLLQDFAVDSTYCPNCGNKLEYKNLTFSHLGDWNCPNCLEKRPKLDLSKFSHYPLSGLYNKYNTNAAVLFAKTIGIDTAKIEQAMKKFSPAFGRQEKLNVRNRNVQIFLSKNPTSFNESLRTIKEFGAKNILFVLNDRIPDGTDVSWIWDVNFEELLNSEKITISGDRAYDMGLRIKYSQFTIHNSQFTIEPDLKKAIKAALNKTLKNHTLYILPTYSAMLEVRKILTGKKIL